MKLKDETKEIGLQQTNALFQLWNNLKDSIFNVLFVLLDNNNDQQSVSGLFFEVGVDYLQMMSFPFDNAVIAVWNGGTTLDNLREIMNTLSIDTFLPSVSFETFLIMVYALIFSIIFVILDIIYVGYSFSKKKFKFTWPLVLLAKIVPLFVTVLFLPIMETLYSVVTCEVTEKMPGVQVMSSFPNIVCWEGWHLFHAIITLIFSTLFVFIACVVALAIFEPRMTTNRLTARQNSTGQVVFIVNKIICQFFFSFRPFQGTWMYCVLVFSLSGWLYWTYNVNEPYYNKTASKFFRIVSTYYFWTNFMLLVSQILYSLQFQGGLIIWISGAIFIALIIIFEKKSNIDKLFSSNLKFRSGEQLESHIKYVLLLIQNQKQDKNSYMLLLGYIEKHKDICTEDDCPLKVPKNNLFYVASNNKNSPSQTSELSSQNLKVNKNNEGDIDIEMQENCIRLVKQLQRMYKNGIKKYPACTKLRLSFAFFYMEKLKNNSKAYEQFAIAQQTEPSFGQEFIIYRFRKIIREKLQQKDKDDDSQLIDIIRLDNHVSLCQEAMLRSAKLHRQFWSELQQQTPDLKKLNNIGSRITSNITDVSLNYKQIAKVNDCMVEITYNYGMYLILIQQQSEKGTELIAKAKEKHREKIESEQIKRKKQFIFDDENIDSCLYPILVVSGKIGQVGQIILANSLFTQLTGFYKEQLLQRNIDKLLPEIYVNCHSNFIKRWLSGQSNSNNYANIIHQGFLKHKSGFIIRVTYKIRFDNERQQFIVSFKPIKSQKYKSVIITDRCGNIEQVSAQIYYLLDIDKQLLEKQVFPIENCLKFPQIEDDQKRDPNLLFQVMITAKGVQQFLNIQRQQIRVKLLEMNLNKSKLDNQIINELETQVISNGTQRIGYIYYITKTITLKSRGIVQPHQNILNQPLFMAQMANGKSYKKLYNVECNEEYQTDNLNQQCQSFKFVNYGVDIKIRRLLSNGDFKKVYCDDQDESDYDFQETVDDQKQLLKVKKLKSPEYQQKIKESINTNITLRQISNIKWGSLLFLLIIAGIISQSIFFIRFQLEQHGQQLEIIVNQIEEIDFISKAVSKTFVKIKDSQRNSFYDTLKNHTVKQQPNLLISYSSFNVTEQKNLTNFIMHLNGHLIQFYKSKGIQEQVQAIYYDYLNLYYALENFENQTSSIDNGTFLFKGIIFTSGLFCISLIFVALWIYQVLRMDRIRTNIMIWFLQIPIYYVNFINSNCNKFMKNYIMVKQLETKGLKLSGNDQYFQQYDDCLQDDQFQEQRKIRKTLIARYNKKTLLSKLDISYAKFLWLLLYASIFTCIFIILASKMHDDLKFLKPQIQFTGVQLSWNYALQIGLNLENRAIKINGKNITALNQQIKQNFKNHLTSNQMTDFNNLILDFKQKSISQLYQSTFFKSLCTNLTEAENIFCRNALNGKLKGGYLTYSKALQNITSAQVAELTQIQQKFINPALLKLVQYEKTFLKTELASTISSGMTILYVFLVITAIGYLIPWMIYLKAQNTSIVRTIKMLNMIPLFLIPRARKQTRQFIEWIIKQANKQKHKN